MSVKRLSIYLQDDECKIIFDHKLLEKFLKSKEKTIKSITIMSIGLSSHKLNIQYIKGTKNILADCLPRLVDAKLTDHNHEPMFNPN